MKMFFEEAKKFLLYNKGYLIIIVLIVGQICVSNFQNKAYNFQAYQYQKQYQKYIAVFGGEIDDEKAQSLIKEEQRIASLEEKSQSLFKKLYAGAITAEEYDYELHLYDELFEEKMALIQIQNQYLYAKEAPQLRYIMDENGWYTAMQGGGLDLFLILCIICVAVYIFCTEYESDMYSIIACTKNGKGNTVLSKLFLLLLVIIAFGFFASFVPLVSSHIKFGLYSAGYPIQSLGYFSDCPYKITILQGYVIIWLLKLFALCLIGLISACLCTLLKKSISVFFVSIVITIVPYFLFNLNLLLKYVPYLGLFLGEYYFRGIEKANLEAQLSELVPIPLNNLLSSCGGGIVIFIVLFSLSAHLWNNKIKKRRAVK